jgi:hypothetical protein
MKQLNISMTDDLYNRLNELAETKGISLASFSRNILEKQCPEYQIIKLTNKVKEIDAEALIYYGCALEMEHVWFGQIKITLEDYKDFHESEWTLTLENGKTGEIHIQSLALSDKSIILGFVGKNSLWDQKLFDKVSSIKKKF